MSSAPKISSVISSIHRQPFHCHHSHSNRLSNDPFHSYLNRNKISLQEGMTITPGHIYFFRRFFSSPQKQDDLLLPAYFQFQFYFLMDHLN